MLCKLWLEHFDIGGGQYLKPASFVTLDNYIDEFDFVKTMSPKEFDLFGDEDLVRRYSILGRICRRFEEL